MEGLDLPRATMEGLDLPVLLLKELNELIGGHPLELFPHCLLGMRIDLHRHEILELSADILLETLDRSEIELGISSCSDKLHHIIHRTSAM